MLRQKALLPRLLQAMYDMQKCYAVCTAKAPKRTSDASQALSCIGARSVPCSNVLKCCLPARGIFAELGRVAGADADCEADVPGHDAAASDGVPAGLPAQLSYEGSAESTGGVPWPEACPCLAACAALPAWSGAMN